MSPRVGVTFFFFVLINKISLILYGISIRWTTLLKIINSKNNCTSICMGMSQGPIVWPLLKWAIWSDKWAFKIRNKDQIWLQTCTTWETCVPLRSCVIRIACLKFSTPNLKFQFCDQIREANSKKATLRVEIKEEMLNFFFLFFFLISSCTCQMPPNWSHFCFLVFLKIAKTGPFGPRNIQITKPAKILASVWIIVIQVSWSKLQVSSLHEIWWHPQLDLWPF